MRVRYGKPIKVKSLLGKQNITAAITNTDSGYCYATNINNSFYGGWGSDLRINENSKKINIISSHKYFLYVKVNMINSIQNQYDGCLFITQNDYLRAAATQHTIVSNTYAASLITAPDNLSVIPAIRNYYQKWTVGDIINYMLVLDLTDIFGNGNEPTAQEFYNKYHQYFPLIAAGEEITIDDKAGQIGYKTLNNDFIYTTPKLGAYVNVVFNQLKGESVEHTYNPQYEDVTFIHLGGLY